MTKKQEDQMKVMHLEVLAMPNGEILFLGKTIGFYDKLKKYLSEKGTE